MKRSREAGSKASWVLGAVVGAFTFGFAAFVGSGGGHGSDLPAMTTVAPISLFSNPLESTVLSALVAFVFWGAIVRFTWAAQSRRQLSLGCTLLALHVLAALWLWQGVHAIPLKATLVALTPHFLLSGATVVAAIRKWRWPLT